MLAVMGYGYRVNSLFSHTPAVMMKGRYKWLKVLISWPTDSTSLRYWLQETMSVRQLWSLLISEFNRLDQKMILIKSPLLYVRSQGFVPISGWNAGAGEGLGAVTNARFGDFYTLQSKHVLAYYKDIYATMVKNRALMQDEILKFFENEDYDPWVCFNIMLKLHRDLSLFSAGKSRLAKRRDVLRNTKGQLWARWIKLLRPISSTQSPIPYDLPPHLILDNHSGRLTTKTFFLWG
jgi:hypothetical protein